MKKLTSLILLSFFFIQLSAQTKQLIVVSSDDNSPLSGVLVTNLQSGSSSITNEEGRVELYDLKITDSLSFDSFDILKMEVVAGNLLNDTVFVEPNLIQLDDITVYGFNYDKFFSKLLDNIPKYYDSENNLYGVIRESLYVDDSLYRLLETSTLMNIKDYSNSKSNLSKKLEIENFNQKYFKNIQVKDGVDMFLPSKYYYQNIILGEKLNELREIKKQLRLVSMEKSENGNYRISFTSDTIDYPEIENASYITDISLVLDSTKTKVYRLLQKTNYLNALITQRAGGVGPKYSQLFGYSNYDLSFIENKENRLILNNYSFNTGEKLSYKNVSGDIKLSFKCVIFSEISPNVDPLKKPVNFKKSIESQIQNYPHKKSNSDIYYPLNAEEQAFINSP